MQKKTIIINFEAPKQGLKLFENQKFNIVYTTKLPFLYPAISSHTDIQICRIFENTFVASPEVYDYYNQRLPHCTIVEGNTYLHNKYPNDIAYNAAIHGKIGFHNLKYTDPQILRLCAQNNIKLHHVNQGYSKCNICFVTENAIITSDLSVYNTAMNNDIEVLLIENGNICLNGFNYGFIGGATGLIEDRKMAVCGDLGRHACHSEIVDFANKHGVHVENLYEGNIFDIGGIICF